MGSSTCTKTQKNMLTIKKVGVGVGNNTIALDAQSRAKFAETEPGLLVPQNFV